MHTLPSLGSQLPVVGFCAQAESAGNWGPSIEAAVIPLAVWFPLMWSMLWSVSQSSCWTTCGDLYHAGLVCWWVLSPRHFDPSFPKEPFSWMEMVWVVITSLSLVGWSQAAEHPAVHRKAPLLASTGPEALTWTLLEWGWVFCTERWNHLGTSHTDHF